MAKKWLSFVAIFVFFTFFFVFEADISRSKRSWRQHENASLASFFGLKKSANGFVSIDDTRDFFGMSPTREAEFFLERESVYEKRRIRVQQTCERLKPELRVFNWTRINRNIYIENKNISYCPIPKVASSTWTRNMMIIGGLRPHAVNHVIAPKSFPIPKDKE